MHDVSKFYFFHRLSAWITKLDDIVSAHTEGKAPTRKIGRRKFAKMIIKDVSAHLKAI